MKIKNHFILSAVTSAIVVSGILSAGFWMMQKTIIINQHGQSIEESLLLTYQLNLFTTEFLYKGGERTRHQWIKSHNLLSNSIEKQLI